MPPSHELPIHRLPSELLSEILILVPTNRGIHLALPNPFPWKIAQVCKNWRDVVFSTPQLWSNITVELDPLRATKAVIRIENLIRAWELCLRRSRGSPLTIHIDASSEQTMSLVSSIMRPLMNHIDQWETMIFGFPLDLLLPFLGPAYHYPRLRDLTLRGSDPIMVRDNNHPHHDMELFSNAPSLSRIRFQEFTFPPARLHLPWTQLTHLTMLMNVGSVGDILYILHDTPNLSSLTFTQFLESSTPSMLRNRETNVVELPYLTKLSWMTYMFNYAPFFDSINTPRLSEITFQCDDDNWPVATIQRFLSRSKCCVTKIGLSRVSPSIASSFLNILPDVEDVELRSVMGTEHLMLALTVDENSVTCMNPNMKRLVVEDMDMKQEIYDRFLTMVRSRLRARLHTNGPSWCSKLESLHISQHPQRLSLHCGMVSAYKFLEQTLSPEELSLITYKEKTFEELID